MALSAARRLAGIHSVLPHNASWWKRDVCTSAGQGDSGGSYGHEDGDDGELHDDRRLGKSLQV